MIDIEGKIIHSINFLKMRGIEPRVINMHPIAFDELLRYVLSNTVGFTLPAEEAKYMGVKIFRTTDVEVNEIIVA